MNITNYDASSIQQLTFREGVRSRIGIYLGSADHTGVIAGLLELVNNATDEALVCPTATTIELEIGNDWASCRDYGRGMPHGPNNFSKEVMINLLTENHSGAKFDANAYGGKSRGLNGTGSAATCCSSDIFKITSYRDGFAWYMEFIEGVPQFENCQQKPQGNEKQGTYIWYKPSQSVFKSEPIEFDFDEICNIIKEYSYFNKGITFIVKDGETGIKKSFCSKNGLMDFAKDTITTPIHKTPIHVNTTENDIDIELIMQWTGGNENFYLFVNGGECPDGGTPTAGIKTAITNFLKKQVSGEYDPNILRKGLVYICSINMKDPIFDGQVKSKIKNDELRGMCQRLTTSALNSFSTNNKEEFNKIVDMLLKVKKAEAAAEKARQQVLSTEKELKDTKKKALLLADKLKDCKLHDDQSILMITEGDSALNGLALGREGEALKHNALFPIRGKIISALKNPTEDVLNNEEVKAIFSALNCGFFDKYNAKKLRYGKIGITADQDKDGDNIFVLLTTLFYYMAPELIKEGRVYRIESPLYILHYNKGKQYATGATERDEIIKKYGKPNRVGRVKGLGELDPDDVANAIFGNQKHWDKLVVKDWNAFETGIQLMMSKDVEPRREYIMNNVDFSRVEE